MKNEYNFTLTSFQNTLFTSRWQVKENFSMSLHFNFSNSAVETNPETVQLIM